MSLAAREGQRVKAGGELVRLDAEELGAETPPAEAAVIFTLSVLRFREQLD